MTHDDEMDFYYERWIAAKNKDDRLEAENARLRSSLFLYNERTAELLKAINAINELVVRVASAEARAVAAEEKLAEAHEHLHKLTAIIPGNDTAYAETTALMASIRASLKPQTQEGGV